MDMLKEKAEKLEAERDALAAQVEVLKDAANFAYCNWRSSSDVIGGVRILVDAVDSTPQQALAEIRAEAGRAGFIAGCKHADKSIRGMWSANNLIEHTNQYAEQIRQGGE